MKHWEITRTHYKVSDFISWQKNKSLVLSPSFQRRSVWKPGAKSYLIDTIVRGLPIPVIFLRERQTNLDTLEPLREVVDGQQRIRTVISYILPKLLKDLNPARDLFSVNKNHNEELADKKFSELDDIYKKQILDYQFAVHVLPSGVDDREILQIFARMNSTGVKLNAQELRNAEFYGEFKTSIYHLAFQHLPRWREWGIFTEDNISRMDEVELTSEFTILMLKGIIGKTQASISKAYEDYDNKFLERPEVERRFDLVMETIDDKFKSNIRHMIFKNKTLFYCLFAYIYDLQFGLGSSLLDKLPSKTVSTDSISWIKLAGDNIKEKKAPEEVIEASARRTTHVGSRKRIFKYLKERG